MSEGRVRVGIGGWNYEPWRGTFYPLGTPHAQELQYASRHVTAIEINSTFYRLQKPATFAKWRESTPDNFMFSIKAPRFIVQRNDLSTAAESVERFISSGITELQAKLGPILWQLSPTKRFHAAEIDEFLSLLPSSAENLELQHAVEVRHPSFLNPEFIGMARLHGVTVVLEDDETHPACADLTSALVYARLRRSVASIKTGYATSALKRWAERARIWASGGEPADLPRIAPGIAPEGATPISTRDVYIYFINGAKERAPAAAKQMLAYLSRTPP